MKSDEVFAGVQLEDRQQGYQNSRAGYRDTALPRAAAVDGDRPPRQQQHWAAHDLMRRYLGLFGAASIELLLADREFIGADWVKFLIEKGPIRHSRQTGPVRCPRMERLWTIKPLLRNRRKSLSITTFQASLPDASTALSFAAKWVDGRKGQKGEWLIVMTSTPNAKAAISAYKNRWAVDCLFADAKTRGFNMEDTRMTAPDKIDTLTAILTLAVAWLIDAQPKRWA